MQRAYRESMTPVSTTKAEAASRPCLAENHDGCRHIIAHGGRLWPGAGPRNFLDLCPCHCHADCPVAPGVTSEEEQLYLSCTCFDHAPSRERVRQGRDELERTGKALRDATRKIRSDMDRSQIRQALDDELATQGVTAPDFVLDHQADMIIVSRRHDGGLSALGTTLRHYGNIGKMLWHAGRKHQPPQ